MAQRRRIVTLAFGVVVLAGAAILWYSYPRDGLSRDAHTQLSQIRTLSQCLASNTCGPSSQVTAGNAPSDPGARLSEALRKLTDEAGTSAANAVTIKQSVTDTPNIVAAVDESSSEAIGDLLLVRPVSERDVQTLLAVARASGASALYLRASTSTSGTKTSVRRAFVDNVLKLLQDNDPTLEEVLASIDKMQLSLDELTEVATEACHYRETAGREENWTWVAYYVDRALKQKDARRDLRTICGR